MINIQSLYNSPNSLEKFYTSFNVSERILLTGHSHQAWPDVAYDGLRQCWNDAAGLIDYKWSKAFEKADAVRNGYKKLMNDSNGEIALAANTHDLLLKFLSAMDWKNRRKIITTDMEFHTVRRQLDRLSEDWIEVVKVRAEPYDDLAERISDLVDNNTACVIVSKVLFKNGRIINNLGLVENKCMEFGTYLLVDAYHVLNAIPFDICSEGLTNSFITGGGYKYCQLGEGNCFLRIPENCLLRPAFTGWFSEFSQLAETKFPGEVPYGEGHYRFAGSTYDPVSHYRAAEVFQFFEENELTPEILREVNLHQKQVMADLFDRIDMESKIIKRDNDVPLEASGGFLVLKTKFAGIISQKLFKHNIYTDYREDHLRLGPAPYISDKKLIYAIEALQEIVKQIK
ncbi:MAG: kynureninase [Candidatus Kapabacteria bacterium]|nr:kynureninase [Ignavibacteriota bacterium]MCW5885812.1 kynureninase [Candidatus Kapabacteria bacterium]